MAEPYTCLVCDPPRPVGDGELDGHLRLFHPAEYASLYDDQPPARLPRTRPAVCGGCGGPVLPGVPSGERPEGVAYGIVVTEVVCGACGPWRSAWAR